MGAAGGLPLNSTPRSSRRNYLVQILQITGGNVSQAARLAKRNRTDFYKLLSRHQLSPDEFKAQQISGVDEFAKPRHTRPPTISGNTISSW